MTQIVPIPPPLANAIVREATTADIPFIDSLQKLHRKQVGFMPTGQLQGKIAKREVLIAERFLTADDADGTDRTGANDSSASSAQSAVQSVGYVIGVDRYNKHDNVGIIYQLNVAPGRQRGFVGAT